MVTHFVVNASSGFGATPADPQMFHIIVTVFLTVVSVGYGIWIVLRYKDKFTKA